MSLLLLSAGLFRACRCSKHRQTHKTNMAMCYCQRTPGQTTAKSWCPHQRSLWAKKILCLHLSAVWEIVRTVYCHQQSVTNITLLMQLRGKAPQAHSHMLLKVVTQPCRTYKWNRLHTGWRMQCCASQQCIKSLSHLLTSCNFVHPCTQSGHMPILVQGRCTCICRGSSARCRGSSDHCRGSSDLCRESSDHRRGSSNYCRGSTHRCRVSRQQDCS